MLRTQLQHPQVLAALAGAGHGSQVLLADANYPAATASAPDAVRVHLNLVPGHLDAVTVLRALLGAVAVEEAVVMRPNTEGPYTLPGDPPVWDAYRAELAASGFAGDLDPRERFDFYDLARSRDVALVVVTGETQWYANLLLRLAAIDSSGRSEVPRGG